MNLKLLIKTVVILIL